MKISSGIVALRLVRFRTTVAAHGTQQCETRPRPLVYTVLILSFSLRSLAQPAEDLVALTA